MNIKTNTNVIDYIARFSAVNANSDIALLKSNTYTGLMTIGTDKKLYLSQFGK